MAGPGDDDRDDQPSLPPYDPDVRFGPLVAYSSDIITVLDAEGRVVYSSPAALRLFGYEPGFMYGQSAFDLVHPDDVDRVLTQFLEELARTGPGSPVEFRMRHADGSWRHVEALGHNRLDDPAVRGVVINTRDVSERVRVEEALRESEERFRGAFERAPIGIVITDQEGRILRCNDALAVLLGYAPDDLVGRTVHELTHPDDRPGGQDRLTRLFAGECSNYQLEKRYLHADGHSVWVSVSVAVMHDQGGAPLFSIGHIQDVTERKAFSEMLAHQALHDPLTGLPNRSLFLDQLRLAQRRFRRANTAVLFLDLDHFKMINDSLGHDAGDQLLVVISDRLRRNLRPNDSVARLGGDEFTVLCHDIRDPGTAMRTAERILRDVAQPVKLARGEVFVTASLGIALSGSRPQDPESLLRDADAAMYRAKEHGRARAEFFEANLRDRSIEYLQTHAALYHGLERDEFEVHYQPIHRIDTGHLAGFEALLRWRHPERGLVGPSEFIGNAEESGLIVPLGTWILEQACRQLAEWRHEPSWADVTMSVNLSPRQLVEPSLPGLITRILRETNVPPERLWLEITETTLMYNTDSAASALRALRGQGIHFSIDDFGTGYSSLSYLKRLPIDALKIDHSFIEGLDEDAEDTAIVTGVISLADALGLATTAEGVERPEQLVRLRSLGCTYAQGNLLASAQPASRAEAVIRGSGPAGG
jgi:diguanylate cyclase (GGDEF)-like protein/PAS domain S-box-containing protein